MQYLLFVVCDDVSVQRISVYVSYYTCLLIIIQEGASALMLAAGLGKTEVVVELVKAGADMEMQNEVCNNINNICDT